MEYSTSGCLMMTDEVPDGVESTFLSFAIFILSWLCSMAQLEALGSGQVRFSLEVTIRRKLRFARQ